MCITSEKLNGLFKYVPDQENMYYSENIKSFKRKNVLNNLIPFYLSLK